MVGSDKFVAVFGQEFDTLFVEVFDTRTERNFLRFSTEYCGADAAGGEVGKEQNGDNSIY